jgi:hypothetical protein
MTGEDGFPFLRHFLSPLLKAFVALYETLPDVL